MKFNFNLFLSLLFMLFGGLSTMTAQTIFWDEDFSDGDLPAGWTNDDASGGNAMWTWCGNPASGQGGGCPGVYSGQTAFASTTAANGFAVMDSDLLGELPNNHIARLTTFAIDCSGKPEVWIKFESFIGVFAVPTQDNAVLRVSTDLSNWVDYNLYDLSGNAFSENPVVSIIDISSEAAGSATVYLQWEWVGNYEYNWNIDDIGLYDGDPSTIFIAAHDMRVNDNFYAIAPNAVTPVSQIETFGFLADIENVGSTDQTNVNLNISIVDNGTSDVVYTEDKFYGTIGVDSLAENQLFDGAGFTPGAVPYNSYTGTYEVTADSVDLVMDNNTQSFQFYISDTTFAKENGATLSILPAASNWEGEDEPHSWAYGNYYHTPNGDGMYARTVSFGLGNADDPGVPGRLLSLYLYEWDDANIDGNADFEERTRIAFNVYEIAGTEALDDIITLPLLSYPSGDPLLPIPLSDGGNYVIMLEYLTIDEVDVRFAASDEFNYGAMNLRSDSLSAPRYAGMLGINGDLDSEPYSSLGFGFDLVPVVRLSIGESPITSVKNILPDNNLVSVSPNPASNSIQLLLDLAEVQNNAQVRILDASGRLLLERSYEQVQKQTFTYDVSQFAAGTYFLHLITEDGIKTNRFIVAK